MVAGRAAAFNGEGGERGAPEEKDADMEEAKQSPGEPKPKAKGKNRLVSWKEEKEARQKEEKEEVGGEGDRKTIPPKKGVATLRKL